MDADKPRRRWYRKKRWVAAVAAWTLVGYPLSVGPAAALANHGHLPGAVYVGLYFPLCVAAMALGVEEPGNRYCEWWTARLARE